MRDAPDNSHKFRESIDEGGLGSVIWSRIPYYAARYYSPIVAGLTICILLLVLSQFRDWQLALAITSLYMFYLIIRKGISAKTQQMLYRPNVQFFLAQIGVIALTIAILSVSNVETSWLWLFYVLIILEASRHCSTQRMFLLFAESCLALVVVRLKSGATLEAMLLDSALWIQCLWLGLLVFIFHYLVRNIQARSETIAAYNAVNSLASNVDMTAGAGAAQWQPLLAIAVERLNGECASAWLVDPKTQTIQLVASVKRTNQDDSQIKLDEGAPATTFPLESSALIARVGHTGMYEYGDSKPMSSESDPHVSYVTTEIAVPINLGTSEHQTTIGVLSVGFRPRSFRRRLLPEYLNFMQGLVNQAKPMLAYAQRLNELVALQKISRTVSTSLDLNEVLDSILQAIIDTLGFEFATISLVDEDLSMIRCLRGINVPQQWLDMDTHSLDSGDIHANIVRTGRTEVLVGWDDRFDRRIFNRFSHAELVRVFTPIEVGDAESQRIRIIGTIEAGYHRSTRAEITVDQLRMLDMVRTQVSMAIEHAQLLQRVKMGTDTLTSLHRSGSVASASDFSNALNEISRITLNLLHADLVMIYRYHRDTYSVSPPAISGEIAGQLRLNLDLAQDTILSRILRKTTPYYSVDAYHDAWLLTNPSNKSEDLSEHRPTFVRRHNIKSVAIIPLVADGELAGVMFVNYRTLHHFNADERQLHELFAQQAAVAIKNAESHDLTRQLIIRNERDHLARELHHSVSQALFGIGLKAQILMDQLNVGSRVAQSDVGKIAEIAQTASNEIGFLINELRTPIEESRHFASGLEEYVRRLRRWYGVHISLEFVGSPPLPVQTELTLLRLAREALNNAARHAHSQLVSVRCETDGQRYVLAIHDDGVGFDLAAVPPGKWGLNNMQELAAQIGGMLSIESSVGQGTTIKVEIPLANDTTK